MQNYTNPNTTPVTYTYGPVVKTPSQYVNRIIFKGQANIGYTAGAIKLDDVKVEQVYFDYLNTTTTQAPGGGNNIYVDAVKFNSQKDYAQKSTNNGNTWGVKSINAWNYGSEVPRIIRISPTDEDKAYYAFASCNNCLISVDLNNPTSDPSTYLNYPAKNHVDIRSMSISTL